MSKAYHFSSGASVLNLFTPLSGIGMSSLKMYEKIEDFWVASKQCALESEKKEMRYLITQLYYSLSNSISSTFPPNRVISNYYYAVL